MGYAGEQGSLLNNGMGCEKNQQVFDLVAFKYHNFRVLRNFVTISNFFDLKTSRRFFLKLSFSNGFNAVLSSLKGLHGELDAADREPQA
jgi:hypothetical protein